MTDPLPGILLLDGATGTELAVRGFDTAGPSWTALANDAAPQLVERIHRDYLEAGASAITANTFRTHARSLAKVNGAGRARELTIRAVEIAQTARDAVNPQAIVLGSVAPLEDCYEPDRAPDFDTCAREHAQMISHLMEACADRILLETMSSQREASAAMHAAAELAPGKWCVSFVTTHEGPPGRIMHGEPMIDLLPQLALAWAVGVNCIAATHVRSQVQLLRRMLPESVRVMAYANTSFIDDDGSFRDSDATDPRRYAEYAMQWLDGGASIIGGCCGTTPATIEAVASALAGRGFAPLKPGANAGQSREG